MARATRGSATAKAMGKHAYYAQIDLDQAKAYSYAVEVMAAGAVSPDGQEGIASFLEKRKPKFGKRANESAAASVMAAVDVAATIARANADEAEGARRLTAATVDALRASGILRAYVPPRTTGRNWTR